MDIILDRVTKQYESQKAVDEISVTVKTGEILGFLGPNGAGKTTTMKMITNYISPSSGEITVGNMSVRKDAEKIKRHIGYLPEHNPLYLDMGIMDYLKFCGELQGVSSGEIENRVHKMIQMCGLVQEKHKTIGEVSKGYRQRVGLAQAMIHDPEILILDEPTTGLDPNQIIEIRKLIRELGREKTVILSTHILPEVEATCDRILIINKGQIVADGTAETLRQQSQGNEIVYATIEDGEPNLVMQSLSAMPSVAAVDFADRSKFRFEIKSNPDATSRRAIFEMCKQNNWALTELTKNEAKLEDIFRNLTLN